MGTVIRELYEALKEAGASEEKACAAAEQAANYEDRFSAIDRRFSTVDRDLMLLKWMVGFNLAMTTGVLFKLFA